MYEVLSKINDYSKISVSVENSNFVSRMSRIRRSDERRQETQVKIDSTSRYERLRKIIEKVTLITIKSLYVCK